MSLYGHFLTNSGKPIDKWMHYFVAYERHFKHLVGRPCTFLEIGAGNGGSSQMWKQWFGPLARIVSLDLNEKCKQFEDEQVAVRIGDQSDPAFLKSVVEEFGPFDAVLDDGSHVAHHIMASIEYLYPRMAKTGVYMVEDVHTAYWKEYGGELDSPDTIVSFFKKAVDKLNASYVRDNKLAHDDFSRSTFAITAYDSILVFEKTPFINKEHGIVGDQALRVNY